MQPQIDAHDSFFLAVKRISYKAGFTCRGVNVPGQVQRNKTKEINTIKKDLPCLTI